jgi:error-prone DNA polymerase
VAYCLSITAVDPIRHGLLFERFLSEARADGGTEAPDIDVDFEADRREEVLDYVYEKYSRQHAAITAVTQMYSAPTAIQDMMRALGYPAEQAFRLSKRLHWAGPAEGADALAGDLGREQGFDAASPRGRALIAAVRAVEGLPRMRPPIRAASCSRRGRWGRRSPSSAPPWGAPSSSSTRTTWTRRGSPSSTSWGSAGSRR